MRYFSMFLLAVFGKIFDFLAAYVGKKVAAGGAVVATSYIMLTAFYVTMKLVVAGLIHQVSNPVLLQAFYIIWPSNAEFCLSAYWTAQVTAFIYREHRENLRAIAYVG